MATQKQKKVAHFLVENTKLDKPLNGGEIVENSGYGESMKLYPKRVIDSDGVREELEVLGFSEENAKRVVSDILLNTEADPNPRLKAADMVFKVKGTYAPEKKDFTTQGEKLASNADLDALAEAMAEKLKEQKI